MRISWHFGLNRVKPSAYGGWEGRLVACCNDATAMAALFARAGYEAKAYFDDDCTRGQIRSVLEGAAAACQPGDWFAMSYSGHGSQRETAFGAGGWAESLCCYNDLLDDFEFVESVGKFQPGVNVVVILDSCFSGGMDRGAGRRIRVAPLWVTARLHKHAPVRTGNPVCNYTLLSACGSDETAADGDQYGAFTGGLLDKVAGGAQTWGQWHAETLKVVSRVNPYQHPRMIQVSGEQIANQPVFA
jgi:hypothetical protein